MAYNPKFAEYYNQYGVSILKTSDKYYVTGAASGTYSGLDGNGIYYGAGTNALTITQSRISRVSLSANQVISYAVYGPSNWASGAKVILWYDPNDSIIAV